MAGCSCYWTGLTNSRASFGTGRQNGGRSSCGTTARLGRGNRIVVTAKSARPVYALGIPTVSLLPLSEDVQQKLLVDLLGEEDGIASWEALHQPELRNLLSLMGNPYWLARTVDVIEFGGGPADSRAQLLSTWVGHVSARATMPGPADEQTRSADLTPEVMRVFADATLKLYRRTGDGAAIKRSQWIRVLSKRVPQESLECLLGDESPFLEKEQLLAPERRAPRSTTLLQTQLAASLLRGRCS